MRWWPVTSEWLCKNVFSTFDNLQWQILIFFRRNTGMSEFLSALHLILILKILFVTQLDLKRLILVINFQTSKLSKTVCFFHFEVRNCNNYSFQFVKDDCMIRWNISQYFNNKQYDMVRGSAGVTAVRPCPDWWLRQKFYSQCCCCCHWPWPNSDTAKMYCFMGTSSFRPLLPLGPFISNLYSGSSIGCVSDFKALIWPKFRWPNWRCKNPRFRECAPMYQKLKQT